MKISILTLFPSMFEGPFSNSIIKLAQEKNLVQLNYINIRDFGLGTHQTVDDTPYGGGLGMVMRVDVVKAALDATRDTSLTTNEEKVVLLTASGYKYTQRQAEKYAELKHLILICGHYEGIDDRVHRYVDEEVSVGDFVVTGGEIPAMLIIDSVTRLIKGVLKDGVTDAESFSHKNEHGYLLEYPHFTRPPEFDGHKVPDVLLSGDHKKIDLWRQEEAEIRTKKRRADLHEKTNLH